MIMLSKTKAKQILRDIRKQYVDQDPPIQCKDLARINIIALREAAGMSPKDVAEALGYTVQTVKRWEKTYPPFDRIPEIAELYGVENKELFPGYPF